MAVYVQTMQANFFAIVRAQDFLAKLVQSLWTAQMNVHPRHARIMEHVLTGMVLSCVHASLVSQE
jgi:hypothetical protein